MESENDYFLSTRAPKEHMDRSAKIFQPPSIASMQLCDSEFFASSGQDFLGWSMDGETTTEPASDDLDGNYQLGSSSSDEDSERQVPWARGSLSWKMSTHVDSYADRRYSQKGESLHNILAKAQPAPRPEVPETASRHCSTREELPEEGLVDIDPEEGKKRGGELMAMLMTSDAAQELPRKSVPARSTEPSLSDASWPAPPRPSHSASARRAYPHQANRPQWAASWESGWESMSTGAAFSSNLETSRHVVAIQHAAHEAFGALLKEVKMSASGVYTVSLHSGMRQYDEVPVLSILSRALWPLLGREVNTLEPIVDLDGQQRLIMRMHGEIDGQSCWEFATTGTCPRGSRCRWEHAAVAVHHAYIEVVY
jgi:hypothetical protein